MLSQTRGVILSTILLMTSSCQITDNWYFCGLENTEDKIIKFNEQRVYSSDVFFPISACSNNIKNCFTADFSFLNPIKVKIIDKRKINFKYHVEKLSDIEYLVTTENKNVISRYKYRNGLINLNIMYKSGGDKLSYNRCTMLQYYLN